MTGRTYGRTTARGKWYTRLEPPKPCREADEQHGTADDEDEDDGNTRIPTRGYAVFGIFDAIQCVDGYTSEEDALRN